MSRVRVAVEISPDLGVINSMTPTKTSTRTLRVASATRQRRAREKSEASTYSITGGRAIGEPGLDAGIGRG